MCTRFMAVRVNVSGSSSDIGFEAAGPSVGLVRGAMPQGTTSPVSQPHVAQVAQEPAERTVVEEPHVGVVTLGVGVI